jgi:outer membrane protein assembly factor BamB
MRITALLAVVICTRVLEGQVNVLTWHNDNARTGQNLQETALTTSNVNATTFGKLFVISVDGKVDAEPVYVAALAIPGNGTHNVLCVVTEHDSAYAFDADTGTQLWHVTLLNGGETTSDPRSCDQVSPEIGITSTPAIDLRMGPHGTMYTVSMSKDGLGNYHHRLHALDLTTGGEQFGGQRRCRPLTRGRERGAQTTSCRSTRANIRSGPGF